MKIMMIISLLVLAAGAALAKPAACAQTSPRNNCYCGEKQYSINWVNMHFRPERAPAVQPEEYAINWTDMHPTERAQG